MKCIYFYVQQSLLFTNCIYFQIKPLDKSSPEVVKLLPLWKAELLGDGRYGIFLSSRELKAQDSDSRDDELMFCIVRQPYFGYLENMTTGRRTHSAPVSEHSLARDEKLKLPVCSRRCFCTAALLSDGAEQENCCLRHQPGQGVSVRQPGVHSVWSFREHRALPHVTTTSTTLAFYHILSKSVVFTVPNLVFADLSSAGPAWSCLSLSTLCVRSRGLSRWTSSGEETWQSLRTSL